MNIKLELMNGAQDGDEFSIKRTSVIGRDRSNEISLALDKYISRKHAKIIVDDPDVSLEDLGSTNGTFYDGKRVYEKVLLDNGEFFRVGRSWFQISW